MESPVFGWRHACREFFFGTIDKDLCTGIQCFLPKHISSDILSSFVLSIPVERALHQGVRVRQVLSQQLRGCWCCI